MKLQFKIFDFIILIVFLAAIFFAAAGIFSKKENSRTLIVQTQEGKFAYSMNRDSNLEFTGLIGKSFVTIENGEAWFEDSPCENKICVQSGRLSTKNQWAACLPNGIIIYIEGDTEEESFDAISN